MRDSKLKLTLDLNSYTEIFTDSFEGRRRKGENLKCGNNNTGNLYIEELKCTNGHTYVEGNCVACKSYARSSC